MLRVERKVFSYEQQGVSFNVQVRIDDGGREAEACLDILQQAVADMQALKAGFGQR